MTESLNKASQFAADTLDNADKENLTYEELFAALTQITAAIILDYAYQGSSSETGLSVGETTEKYVEYLKADVAMFVEMQRIANASVSAETTADSVLDKFNDGTNVPDEN